MASAAEKNPVELRLDLLGGLWMEFADHPTARVLRWLADGDARQIIDVFIELHHQHPAGVPDVFIPFETPFRDETSYAADLLRAWRAWFDGLKDDLIDLPRDPTWRCPSPRPGEAGAAAVARAAASFREAFAADFRNLAVALIPPNIGDAPAWNRWLTALAKAEIPPEVRFLVIDPAEAPRLAALAAAEPKRVLTQTPVIRTTEIYKELLAEAGGSGPGVVFRKHFVGMLSAAKEGDVPAAETAGKHALTVAGSEKWYDLQVAAQMGLAGIWSGAGRPAEALAGYRAAVGFSDAIPPEHPAGAVLKVQTRMAVAGMLFGMKGYAEAAPLYEAAAPMATAADQPMLALENWRMAAACYEQLKDDEKNWACGERAIAAGAGLAPDVRGVSTLSYAGQSQLRLCAKRAYADRRDGLFATMNSLVGSGWEARRS